MNSINKEQITRLVQYIKRIETRYEPVTQKTPYYHMGATITDAILQAGLNYEHVVYPRVVKLLNTYKDYRTTCDFIILYQTIPLQALLNWKNEIKLQRIKELSCFFYENKLETENQLADWLNYPENLEQLSFIKGIGPKTIDYLKMLSGNQAIAIDRHLFKFLELAGIFINTYNDANLIYSKAAEMLNINKYELDNRIWLYMSKN